MIVKMKLNSEQIFAQIEPTKAVSAYEIIFSILLSSVACLKLDK